MADRRRSTFTCLRVDRSTNTFQQRATGISPNCGILSASMHGKPSFFVAGTMQGSHAGVSVVDQSYRGEIRRIISQFYSPSKILCPLDILTERFGSRRTGVLARYQEATSLPVLERTRYDHSMMEVADAFTELVIHASKVDVVVAYVPEHEASMGTAMEIWSAYVAGRIIIGISPMMQNLALVSTCTILVRTLPDFEGLLSGGWLDHALGLRL